MHGEAGSRAQAARADDEVDGCVARTAVGAVQGGGRVPADDGVLDEQRRRVRPRDEVVRC